MRAHLPAPAKLWCFLLAGHGLASATPLPAALEAPSRIAAACLAAVSLAAGARAGRFRTMAPASRWLHRGETACGLSALLLAGAALAGEADRCARPLPVHPRPVRITVEGRVLDTTAADAARGSLTFEVRSVRAGGRSADVVARVLLRWPSDGPPPAWALPGMSVRLTGDYRPPDDARNPGGTAPGRWLTRLGLQGSIEVDPTSGSVLAPSRAEEIPWGGLLRHRLARFFSEALSQPVAALARGMSLGDRSGIAPAVRDAFRDGGTIHILSISGLHVCVLAGIISLAAVALRLRAAPALLIELASLWAYVLLVGAPASASRSAILWTAVRGGRLGGRVVRPLTGWGLAGLLLHLCDPGTLSDPGFQLSFAAVLGLAASGPLRIADGGPARRAVLGSARACVAAVVALTAQSLCAEAGTLGIQARYFGALPVVGLLLNLAVIPLCGVFMAAMLVHLGCALLVPALAPLAAGGVDASGLLMLVLTARAAAVLPPVAVRHAPSVPAIALGLAALLLAAAAWEAARSAGEPSRRRAARWCALGAVMIAWLAPLAIRGPGVGEAGDPWVLALDVGQGDATVVHVPGAGTLLVDAGPASDARDEGRFAVEPALRAEGVQRLDRALLSHAHRDHYGGFAWLAGRAWFAGILENGSDPRGAWRVPIARRSPRRPGAGFLAIRADTALEWGDGSIQVLVPGLPPAAARGGNAGENNRSLVATVRTRNGSVCLAGDVESDAERTLLPRLTPVRVLKVPHHGSDTSSDREWISALAPRVAIISCGEGNRFGHPDAATVGRYLKRGVRVLRTDEEGAIRITLASDGALISTRAHPSPEFLRWAEPAPVSPFGHSP